jgi:hypothetical protein
MKKKTKGKKKLDKVFREFKDGKLKSSDGKKVTNRKQAIAIALSEKERASKRPKSSRRK